MYGSSQIDRPSAPPGALRDISPPNGTCGPGPAYSSPTRADIAMVRRLAAPARTLTWLIQGPADDGIARHGLPGDPGPSAAASSRAADGRSVRSRDRPGRAGPAVLDRRPGARSWREIVERLLRPRCGTTERCSSPWRTRSACTTSCSRTPGFTDRRRNSAWTLAGGSTPRSRAACADSTPYPGGDTAARAVAAHATYAGDHAGGPGQADIDLLASGVPVVPPHGLADLVGDVARMAWRDRRWSPTRRG